MSAHNASSSELIATANEGRHRSLGHWKQPIGFVCEWLGWCLLTAMFVIGHVAQYDTHIPQGHERIATVPLFNLWTVGWNANRLAAGLEDYWHAPIFHPHTGTFTYSEMQPTMLVVAPGVWWISLAMAYNFYLIGGLGLTATIARRLFQLIGTHPLASILGAIAMLTLPFIHWQIGVIQLTAIWGPLWILYALLRFRERPTYANSIVLGIACGLTYAACNYYGLFISILSFWGVILFRRQLFRLKTLAGGGLCIVVSAVIAGPLISAQQTWLTPIAEERSMAVIQTCSASSINYRTVPNEKLAKSVPSQNVDVDTRESYALGVGNILAILSLFGLIAVLFRRTQRQWSLFVIAIGVTSFLLSLGPRWRLGGGIPYSFLYEWYPGVKHVRSPYRFAVFVQMAQVFLATAFISDVLRWIDLRQQVHADRLRIWQCRIGKVIAVLTLIAGSGETWPRHQNWVDPPSQKVNMAWIQWLRQETPPGTPVVCIPFASGHQVEAFLPSTEWMLLGLHHERPLLNGYSGFFPPISQSLRATMDDFPAPHTLDLLTQYGATYVVVSHSAIGWDDKLIRPVFDDLQAGISIYRLDSFQQQTRTE